jgi:NhaA family Na+:H+ antiporter
MSAPVSGRGAPPPGSLDATLNGRRRAFRDVVAQRLVRPAQAFMHTETAGGAVVVLAALVAFAWANSPWNETYFDLLHTEVTFHAGRISIDKDLAHLVNDGLMVLFFFVVGLEVKRELLHGELANPRRAALPVMAAFGGMLVPALIFTAFNAGGDGARGWGIPMATDIAFAVGVLALLGNRVPFPLKIFLLALAVADDLGAILVIAVFYTESLSAEAALWALGILAVIVAAGRLGIRSVAFYSLIGVVFWFAVFKSGIHATIAGVVLALLTPSKPDMDTAQMEREAEDLLRRAAATPDDDKEAQQTLLYALEDVVRRSESPLDRLERMLHPWTTFLIVPIFALANAGVEVSGGIIGEAVTSPITIGAGLGLLLGKPIGVFLFAWLSIRLGIAVMPHAVTWTQMMGAGLLAGIGFTVSLFVTDLAYTSSLFEDEAKIGILAASIVSAVLGFTFLRVVTKPRPLAH